MNRQYLEAIRANSCYPTFRGFVQIFPLRTQTPLVKHPRSEAEGGKSDDEQFESAYGFYVVVFGGGAEGGGGHSFAISFPTPSCALPSS